MSRASSRTPMTRAGTSSPFAIECCHREPARRLHQRHQTGDAAEPQGIVFGALDMRGGLFEQPAQEPRNVGGADGVLDIAKRQGHRRIGIRHIADPRGRRHLASVEFQFAMRRRRQRVQRRHRLDDEAGCLLRNQKQPVSLASILDRDHGQHQKHIRDRTIRDPGLAAANDETGAVRFGDSLQMFRMGAGVGLGDRDRRTDLRPPQCAEATSARWSASANPEMKNRAVNCRAAKPLASPNSPVFAAIACSAIAIAQ